MILLILSDFDPEGEEIPQTLLRTMRDDFNIYNVLGVRVALKHDQVKSLVLPPSYEKPKRTSPRFKKFVKKYGNQNTYELEAIPPETLQQLLQDAIESVIDSDLLNSEISHEKQDAAALDKIRNAVYVKLGSLI